MQGKGYDMSCFTIDWEAKIATCPQGHNSVKWLPMRDRHGHDTIHIDFSQKDCRPCPSRSMCTKAKSEPRELTLRPQEEHLALQTARQWQKTEAFKEAYDKRAGIEGTLSQAIRAFELRTSRYLGLAKTHLQHLLTAAAVNLVRADAWLTERPRTKTRTSRFAALATAQAC